MTTPPKNDTTRAARQLDLAVRRLVMTLFFVGEVALWAVLIWLGGFLAPLRRDLHDHDVILTATVWTVLYRAVETLLAWRRYRRAATTATATATTTTTTRFDNGYTWPDDDTDLSPREGN